MAGYKGYSMSNNAVNAYENGEKPFSKWTKADIVREIRNSELEFDFAIEKIKKVPVKVLRSRCLTKTSWHHTSSYYNTTDFYSVDLDFLMEIDNEQIDEWIEIHNKNKNEEIKEEKWECEFLEWSGTRKHPKATEITEIGVVKGDWFYRQDGTKKKTTANGFRFIKKID